MSRIGHTFGASFALAIAFAAGPAAAAGDPRVSSGEQTVRCESNSGREQFCAAPNTGGVRVVREISNAPCVAGQSFRYTREGVYVRNGCRAEFAYRPAGGGGGGWGGSGDGWGGSGGSGGNWGNSGGTARIGCTSSNGRENFCRIDNDGRARVVQQVGQVRCVEGQNWRVESGGIRVRGNCSAIFEVRTAGGGGGGGGNWQAQSFTVKCESNKHRWAECPVDIAGSVELQKQDSHAPCVRGWTWGTMGSEGIWVSDGCRGRFVVNGRQSNRTARGGEGLAPPGVQRVQPR